MEVTSTEFYDIIQNGHALVVASFGANWSGTSSMMQSVLRDVIRELDKVEMIYSDVENNEELANEWGVFEVPTILLFQNGEVVDHLSGLVSRSQLRRRIGAHL